MLRKMLATLAISIALLALVYAFKGKRAPLQPNFFESGSDTGAAAYQNIQPLKVTGDAIPWTVFAKTQEIEAQEKDKDGFINYWLRPGFTTELRAKANQTVTLMGFMFPLSEGRTQTKFLFGPYPMSCPYHYHATNNQIVLISPQKPMPFSIEPIRLRGVLKLHENHPEMVFYTLEQAVFVK